MASSNRIWVGKLTLTDFRNYHTATLTPGPEPVVLLGANGAGKTNCLEAVSLLTAGRGLRASTVMDLGRQQGQGGWAVSAHVQIGDDGERVIGTGLHPQGNRAFTARSSRIVKIDGQLAKSSSALANIRMLWLTPAQDGLFTGPASERRRFLDRFVLSLEPAYAAAAAAYDRAMRQRNKALEIASPSSVLDAIEHEMAHAAAEMAGTRVRAVTALQGEILAERDRRGGDTETAALEPFPWAELTLVGDLEQDAEIDHLAAMAVNAQRRWRESRARDAAAGRTLIGPHRSDLMVAHGPKAMAAKFCSTGEQKALLIALILAQARLIKLQNGGLAPLLLLDEVAAHLDEERRGLLFSTVLGLNAQVWMTGTDSITFAPLQKIGRAQVFLVSNGGFLCANAAERL